MAASSLGYYSGLLEGRKAVQDMEIQRETANLRNRAQGLDEEKFKLNKTDTEDQLLSRQLQRKNLMQQMEQDTVENEYKRQAIAREEEERSLAGMAMKANIPDMLNGERLNETEQFAAQLTNTAKAVATVNPKLASDYMKQAEDLRNKSLSTKESSIKLKENKVKAQREIALGVQDEQSAQEATVEMAKLGFNVPERFRNWSDESQVWWARQGQLADSFVNSAKTQASLLRAEIDQKDTESKILSREAKVKADVAKETRLREKLQQSKGLTKYEPKRITKEQKLLSDQDERFDDLDSVVQKAVAEDVLSLANQYMRDDPTMDMALAQQRARRDILGRIDEEGNYKVIADKGPEVGAVVKGYVFLGGDPSKPTSWKKQ
jgi:hypothetical protein